MLRYATPFLHVVALGANVALLGERLASTRSRSPRQLAVLGGRRGWPRSRPRSRIFALCRYYVLMTMSLARRPVGRLLRGTPATWERERERPS